MYEKNPLAILASYTTFKELYRSKKYRSSYQILAEFVQYIILVQHLLDFTAEEMRTRLKHTFGFNLPTSVICIAIKSLPFVTLKEHKYNVNIVEAKENIQFDGYKTKANTDTKAVENALTHYAKTNCPDVEIDEDKLIQEFIYFCINESKNPKYREIVSKFVMTCETDSYLQDSLNSILEGGVLYKGLTFNTKNYGSMTDNLTIFLDTEILFDIVGYNGTLYKSLAEDFLDIIKAEIFRSQHIKLRYFSVNKNEIERIFNFAERIIEGDIKEPLPKQALKSILEGCQDSSDIAEKKVDFYHMLRTSYRIVEDDKNSYYLPEDNIYNLEGTDLTNFSCGNNSDNATIEEGLMYCSHINKLRKGQFFQDFAKCKFVFVTRTTTVLEVSKFLSNLEKDDESRRCDYALHLNNITNILWYKLNKGFGSMSFPKNLDSICRARQILSGYVTQGVYEKYNQLKSEYENGMINLEHLEECILTMREKKLLPEELTVANMTENLDFDDAYFDKKAEEIAQKDRLLDERNERIKELNKDKQTLFEKDSEKQKLIEKQKDQIDLLNRKINQFKQIEADRKNAEEEREREEQHQNYLKTKKRKYAICIFIKVTIPLFLGFIIYYFCQDISSFALWYSFALTVIGFFFSYNTGLYNDFKQFTTDDYNEQQAAKK